MAPKIGEGWPFRVQSESIDMLICMLNVLKKTQKSIAQNWYARP